MNLEQLKKENKALKIGLKAMERLAEIREGLIQHKSQLIDGGMAECSTTVSSVRVLIKKTDING